MEITLGDVQTAVKNIWKWSTSDRDIVYNFWLKYLTSSHPHLTRLFIAMFRNPKQRPDTTLQFRIFLIPKVAEPCISNCQPGTTMSNLLKLLSKIVLAKIRPILLKKGLLARTKTPSKTKVLDPRAGFVQ